MILWSAHCDMWSAQSSKFSIAAHVSSELSKHTSQHALQSASFLYIIVLCQLWLVELSRFQYYLNCDCMFVLFNLIESYICKAQLHYLTKFSSLHLLLIELYSSCHEVKNSFVNLLCNMSRDSLQNQKLIKILKLTHLKIYLNRSKSIISEVMLRWISDSR